MAKNIKNIVVIGGGTGTALVLRALRKYPLHLTALPAMMDDGGSTGILRRELGVLPAGDVRQCIIALADQKTGAERLLKYRFTKGTLAGHNVGNILLAALEKEHASFEKALLHACTLFHTRGMIHPTTLQKATLIARIGKKTIRGQSTIHKETLPLHVRLELDPLPRANPQAERAIRNANAIIFAPSDWYSSIVPALLVPGIQKNIKKSSAVKIHVCNLVTTKNHTAGWNVATFRQKLEELLRCNIDYTIYNTKVPKGAHAAPFVANDRAFVKFDGIKNTSYIPKRLLLNSLHNTKKGDLLERNPVRHNERVLGRTLMQIFEKS